MTPESRKLGWDLFCELRKELVELQKIRAQVVGFKITFVSIGIGVVASNSEKIPPVLIIVPAIAAICLDFLMHSYSYAIKRTGFYARLHLEPIIREEVGWPQNRPLWEEFMAEFGSRTSTPPTGWLATRWWRIKQRLADLQNITVVGNLGITVLAVAAAGIVLFRSYDTASALAMNVPLVLLVVWDYRALFRPSKIQDTGSESLGYRNPKACVEFFLEKDGRYIAVRRLQYPQTGKLDFVGGFAEPQDPSIEHAAKRELKEETGLDLDLDRLHYVGSFNDHYGVAQAPTLIFCYLVQLKTNETPVCQHEEFSEFLYLTTDEVRCGAWAFQHQLVAFERMLELRERAGFNG